MKLKVLIVCAILAAFLGGCRKSDDGLQTGHLAIQLSAQDDIVDVTRSSISSITTLPADGDFTLTVKKQGEVTAVWTGNVSNIPAEGIALTAGLYTVEAVYGSAMEEGFDKPYFSSANGGVAFTVNGGVTSSVRIPVTLMNTILKIVTTETFDNYFPEHHFRVTTAAGSEIDFAKGETRGAFIDAYKFTLSGTLINQAGRSQNFSKEYVSVNPATCYTIKFDAPDTGGTTVTITFNDIVTTVDLGDIELNE